MCMQTLVSRTESVISVMSVTKPVTGKDKFRHSLFLLGRLNPFLRNNLITESA